MKSYESLQLVNYDGEMIPSGYLFGDISARIAITYLKSIGAPESAVDKIKELEVNKILYYIEVAKSSSGKHYLGRDPKTGKQYGPGTGNGPVPRSVLESEKSKSTWNVHEISEEQANKLTKQGAGSAGDVSTMVSATPVAQYPQSQNLQQVPAQKPQPQIIGETTAYPGASHLGKSNVGPAMRNKVGPETTTDIRKVSEDIYDVSFAGNKPNIAMNMLVLLRRYSPAQATALEKFLLSGGKKGHTMRFNLKDIPLEIRDEIMELVLNPSMNFMQIHEKLNRISNTELEYSYPISDELKKRFAADVSQDMYAVFKGLNIVDMVNSGVLGIHHIENVFPVLADAMRANMDMNGSDKVSEDFALDSSMFIVPWDFSKEKVTSSLSAVSEAIKSPSLTLSEFSAKFSNKRKGNKGPAELGTNLLPVFYIILDKETPEEVVDELGKYLTGLGNKGRREKFITMVRDIKSYLETLDGSDPKLPTLENLKNIHYTDLHTLPEIIESENFPARKEPFSSMFVDMVIAMAKEARVNGENSKYGARKALKNGGGLRTNNLLEKIASLPTSDSKLDTDLALAKKRDRCVKAFKAATVISIAGFNEDNKESTFMLGKKAFYSAHDVLSQWSGNFDPIDFTGFMRMSPLVVDGERIFFIDDDCSVKEISVFAPDAEKKEFAENVYRSLEKMIESDMMDSDRAAYAMLAVTKPSLVRKFDHKQGSSDHLTDEKAQRTYKVAAKATSSFITKLIDPIMGGSRIQNGVGGKSIHLNSKYQSFRDKYPELHEAAEKITVTGSGSVTIQGKTTSFSSPAEFEVFLRNLVATELGVDPKKISVSNDKITDDNQLAWQMVKSYMTLGQFNMTMAALSDRNFVKGLIEGTSTHETLRKMFPQAGESILMDIKLPDMSDLSNHLLETFEGHVDAPAKIEAAKSFLIDAIVKGSSDEVARRKDADPFSASQLSEIYEAISATGNFISQLANYKEFKIFPSDDTGGGAIGALLDSGSKIQLGKGDTPTEHFIMGTRASTEKGSHIDAINSRVSYEGGVSSITTGFLEFKFISSGTRAAHLLASSTPLRDIAEALDSYDKISLDPVMNVTNVIDNPESSDVYPITWNCHVGAETMMSNDGNKAHARRMGDIPKRKR